MCELDYKATSDTDNYPEKTKPNNIHCYNYDICIIKHDLSFGFRL